MEFTSLFFLSIQILEEPLGIGGNLRFDFPNCPEEGTQGHPFEAVNPQKTTSLLSSHETATTVVMIVAIEA